MPRRDPGSGPCLLVLSCEHATPRVPARGLPARLAAALGSAGARRALAGHRGWDPGALALAREMARALDAPLLAAPVSRLVVDTNRSLHHPALLSAWSRGLSPAERQQVVERWWRPYRQAVEAAVRRAGRRGRRVVHLSVHTFTPRLAGRDRRCDVGLLYDPRRPRERALCAAWKRELEARLPRARVRRNHPYRGAADGMTTHLRRILPDDRYLGIELEVSQARLVGMRRGSPRPPRALARALIASLRACLPPPDPAKGPRAIRSTSAPRPR